MRMFVALMIVPVLAGASVARAQGVSTGVKGGVSFATLSDNSAEDVELDRRTGIVAGGFVTWPVRERFSVQLEGLFTQKGAAISQDGITGTTKLDYVEVPLLFVASTAPQGSGATSVHVFGGPSIAFRISAKGTGSFQGNTVDVDIPDEDIERVDLGVVVGAGVAFNRLSVEGRYTIGLSNINRAANDPTTVKNRSLAVLGGVRF